MLTENSWVSAMRGRTSRSILILFLVFAFDLVPADGASLPEPPIDSPLSGRRMFQSETGHPNRDIG